jgi:two-component system chemotaxis sensor kinase CheA
VGLDVVRRKVESLRGTVELETRLGQGSTFTLRLPLTLAIIQGFRVEVAGDVYILPLEAVAECLDLPAGETTRHGEREGVLELRGRPLPYLRLRRLLGLEGQRPARESVVVVGQGAQLVGLAVDALLGESQVVIKPLGRSLRNLPALAGSAILGDGRVALILDVAGLLRLAAHRPAAGPVTPTDSKPGRASPGHDGEH